MKKMTKILSLVALSTILFISSCKKKEDPKPVVERAVVLPAANVSTYTGDLGYNGSGSPIAVPNTGTATITQSSDKIVSISFNSGVPTLSGLKFEQSGSNYVSFSEDGSVAGITLSGNNLKVAASKDSKTWAFDGDK
jgi:hypothetical protein